MSTNDLGVATAITLCIFILGYLLNRGKSEGRGFEIACVIALGLICWAYLARHNYFNLVHYSLH